MVPYVLPYHTVEGSTRKVMHVMLLRQTVKSGDSLVETERMLTIPLYQAAPHCQFTTYFPSCTQVVLDP